MAIILPANTLSAGGFSVDNSCRFNSGDSPQLSKSISSTSTTWTFSAWIKRAGFGNYYFLSWGASAWVGMGFGSTDYLQYYETTSGSNPVTTAKYRDPSAWYHIVVKNAAGTITFYVNGATPAGSGGTTGHALSSTTLYVGSLPGSNYTNAYMSEVCFIDGTAYSASDFGEYDEDSPTIWKPKDVSGLTFGSDGFYLDFKDSANLGNDANGGTDLTETNIAAADQATDTPTNNFCTMNPLDKFQGTAPTFAQGNCYYIKTGTGAGNNSNASGTIYASSGKWYAEFKTLAGSPADANNLYGILGSSHGAGHSDGNFASDTKFYGIEAGGNKWIAGSQTASSQTDKKSAGTIIMLAVDLDNGKMYVGEDGTWDNSGDPTSGATGTGSIGDIALDDQYTWNFGNYGRNYTSYIECNFGGCPAFTISSGNADGNGYGNFEYAVPSGYFALCTKNLAEYG